MSQSERISPWAIALDILQQRASHSALIAVANTALRVDIPIDAQQAEIMSRSLGGTVADWMERERLYRLEEGEPFHSAESRAIERIYSTEEVEWEEVPPPTPEQIERALQRAAIRYPQYFKPDENSNTGG